MSQASDADQLLRSMGKMCTEHDPDVFRSVLDRVGDKWSLLLIGVLEMGPMRFTELLRTVPGISRRMLTLTLRALERDGLVRRTIYPEVPPRVEYQATELGVTLQEPVLRLAAWVADHQGTIVGHRVDFDRRGEADGGSELKSSSLGSGWF